MRALTLFLAAAIHSAAVLSAAEWMQFPAYRRAVLTNGVTLLLIEKHTAPLIHLSLTLKTGSALDPAGKEGLADVTNDLLRKGAGSRTADQIADDLDFIGAKLSSSTALEFTRVDSEFLTKDLTSGLEIFSELILQPKFPAEEAAKILQQRVDQLKAQKDNPAAVIANYHKQFLFGDHPYARPAGGTEISLAGLQREDLVRFHRDAYVSSNMVIVACGDFRTAEMERRLAGRFGSLPARGIQPRAAAPAPARTKGKRLLLVDKPDATQTDFRIGSVAMAVNDPERLTADLVNTLFGGRFTSRLNTSLRIDSGLTYGASSSFERNRQPGGFSMGSFTKNASTAEAIDLALQVLETLHENGVTESELASAKAYLKGQFGPTLETPDQLGIRLGYFEIFGLDPKNEVDEFAARLDAITLADVRRVISRHFPREDLVFTLIGKAAEIAPAVKKYAPATKTFSITEPGFGRKKD